MSSRKSCRCAISVSDIRTQIHNTLVNTGKNVKKDSITGINNIMNDIDELYENCGFDVSTMKKMLINSKLAVMKDDFELASRNIYDVSEMLSDNLVAGRCALKYSTVLNDFIDMTTFIDQKNSTKVLLKLKEIEEDISDIQKNCGGKIMPQYLFGDTLRDEVNSNRWDNAKQTYEDIEGTFKEQMLKCAEITAKELTEKYTKSKKETAEKSKKKGEEKKTLKLGALFE